MTIITIIIRGRVFCTVLAGAPIIAIIACFLFLAVITIGSLTLSAQQGEIIIPPTDSTVITTTD